MRKENGPATMVVSPFRWTPANSVVDAERALEANSYADSVRTVVRTITVSVPVTRSVSVVGTVPIVSAVGDSVRDGGVVRSIGNDRSGVDDRGNRCPINNSRRYRVSRVADRTGAALCRCVLAEGDRYERQCDHKQNFVEHEESFVRRSCRA